MEKIDSDKKIRVLLSKPGIDGHEWGVLVVARALRNAGMEVIYTGMWQTEDMIVKTALEEDVHVIALSSLGAVHKGFFTKLMRLVNEKYEDSIPVVIGGIITDVDRPYLEEIGLTGFFGPGSSTFSIIEHIRERAMESSRW